jgi:hypothetical protein
MEGLPRALPFSYRKALAFSSKVWRKEKDEEDGLESGRQPLKKSSAQQIHGPQITKERKRQCFT